VGIDSNQKAAEVRRQESGAAAKPATLSAARLAVAARRAAAEAGENAALLGAEPIAIVGMGCRFPGGGSGPDGYWALLEEGRSGIRMLPEERWGGRPDGLAPHLRMGGWLDGVDQFDAEFFGIAPREAKTMDPQQRLLLEVAWEALDDAGIAPGALSGSDAGVFVSVYNSDYARLQFADASFEDTGGQAGVGAAHSIASGRISFLLNLRGPCMTVDTACSSSLTAMHLASQALRRRECSVALAGGAALKLLPDEIKAFAQWGMLAGDGRAKTFDAGADGFVPGEGCGVIVLKRLSDAVAQGDRIHAVVRGTAVNHDGRSSVLTAPNGPAQEAVMRLALSDARVDAGDVGYVETHGTGTALGDPIEVEALDAVYGAAVAAGVCVLGAVKTNIGHLEAAAGVAGVIKAALALEHEAIPRNLNFERLNPQIQLRERSRLELATERRDWFRAQGRTRFAAVSSFGLGGTNAHVILEEAPALPAAKAAGGEWCLPISAHTAAGLMLAANEYAALLRRPDAELAAIARTAARGRDHGAFRLCVTGATAAEAAAALEERLATLDVEKLRREVERAVGGGLAFVFSGQGSIWAGALDALAEASPTAEKVIAECERITQAAAGWSLRAAGADEAALKDTAKGQAVIFALEAALMRVLEEWGAAPDAVVGHSVGEAAAAVTAGLLTLEEGMRLVLRRGARMSEAEAGRMLAARMDRERAEEVAGQERITVAAVNGPQSVVFAGSQKEMEWLRTRLEGEGVESQWLDVAYAFHSGAMEVAARGLAADLGSGAFDGWTGARRVPEKSGAAKMVSTVSGSLWKKEDGDAAYWARGIRERVRFVEAVEELGRLGCSTVVEVGPHPVLLRNVGETLKGVRAIATMRRGQKARGQLLRAAAALYESGRELRWEKIYPGPPGHAKLPGYPWERKRYWLTERAKHSGSDGLEKTRPEKLRRAKDSGLHDLESSSDVGWSGRELASPFVEGRILAARLDVRSAPWLGEHCFEGRPILPFAAWLEMARRAAESAGAVAIRDFVVGQRLTLGDEPVTLQTLAGADGRLRIAVQEGLGWSEMAGGGWALSDAPETFVDLAEWRTRPGRTVDVDAVYAGLSEAGLEYGPAFRGLRAVRVGAGWALGEIDATHVGEEGGLHPALLDACLQVIGAMQDEAVRGEAMLPVSVREYRVARRAQEWPRERGERVYALVEVQEKGSEIEAKIRITDVAGAVLAELLGLAVRRVGRSLQWRVQWVAAGEQAQLSLVAARQAGSELEILRALLPEWREDGKELLSGGWEEVSAGLLKAVAREASQAGSARGICIVTRGAAAVAGGDRVNPEEAAIWGLARTMRAEYPAIPVMLVDLPGEEATLPQGQLAEEMACVAAWVRGKSGASAEAALRGGRMWEPRLKKAAHAQEGPTVLEIGTPGLLETLHAAPYTPQEPEPGEVQIAVRTHGLNFRDVLTAMGTYAGVAAPMGAEVAGVVTKAGAGSAFRIGDAVMAFAPASLRSVATLPEAFVMRKPAALGWAEAATVPVAFLTAQYGFAELAQLQAGQTVLVHAAAGGLGQAAAQLARRCGARVIATAGSEAKRAWLRAQGIEDVFDSRSESFADEVLRVTEGRGVDVVLNALPWIEAGLRALAQGGVFLEVGKRDIWSAEQVEAARPDVRYWAFDLGEIAMREPELIRAMLAEITEAMERGELRPIAHESFAMSDAEAAFRKMAGARHVGKLALMREDAWLSREAWREELQGGAALITGGMGALGLATARWLLGKGVRVVTLVSRSGGSETADALAREFAERVRIARADAADREEMRAVMARIREAAPLRVVVHAAGEAMDGVLAKTSGESLAAAMRTKVEGARVLADLTVGDSLLATIYYSSLVGVVGGEAQGGYAAANAFLDGMAEERDGRGLRTLSVAWGRWAEGGMAARLSEGAASRAGRRGFRAMAAAQALEAMESALLAGASRAAIADMDWEQFAEGVSDGPAAAFFAEFLPERRKKIAAVENAGSKASRGLLAKILAAPKAERAERMESYVRDAARKVLGLSSGTAMPAERALQEMGLDSLMALELRNMLAQAAGRSLSATLLFDYPTIRGLAGYVLELLEEKPNVAAVEQALQPAASVEAMSEAEAEAMLLAELDALERKA